MGHRAFVIFHFKVLEGDAEGQGVHLDIFAFLYQIGVGAFALAQMEHALAGGEMREQGTGQNDDEREVEHHGEDFPHTLFQKPYNGGCCQQGP